ncbi:MAG: Pr6Pr family membrane protein [Oscillospiraceae bacterium]|jgi:hypothetical protein|nr:Pr6Pr family membrane protein [Oscillospiraceae bacterium]
MLIKNRVFALALRAVGVVVSISGILATMWTPRGFAVGALLYYTLLSNIAVTAYFVATSALTARALKRDGLRGSPSFFPKTSMVLAVDILLTMMVYWLMLAPTFFTMGSNISIFSYGNVVAHTVTPLLMIFDYLLLNERGAIKAKHSFLVLLFPFAYVVFAVILEAAGYVFYVDVATGRAVHAPYYFLDIERSGFMVVVYLLVILVFLLIFGYLCYLLDRKRGNEGRER